MFCLNPFISICQINRNSATETPVIFHCSLKSSGVNDLIGPAIKHDLIVQLVHVALASYTYIYLLRKANDNPC